jgi:hypothetical protein
VTRVVLASYELLVAHYGVTGRLVLHAAVASVDSDSRAPRSRLSFLLG